MIRALVALLAASLLALAAAGVIARNQAISLGKVRAENATLTEGLERAAKQRKADAATLVARQAANAATGRKLAQAQEALHKARQANLAWSEADVPTAVQEALLRGSEGCKKCGD